MNKITNIFRELTEKDLIKAIEEISQKKETGILVEGIIRNITRKIKEIIVSSQSPLEEYVEKEITYEISRRWYNERSK